MAVELPWKKLPDTFNFQILIVIPFENFHREYGKPINKECEPS